MTTLATAPRTTGGASWIPDDTEAHRWSAEWIWSAEPALAPRSMGQVGAHDQPRGGVGYAVGGGDLLLASGEVGKTKKRN